MGVIVSVLAIDVECSGCGPRIDARVPPSRPLTISQHVGQTLVMPPSVFGVSRLALVATAAANRTYVRVFWSQV